MQQHRYSLLNGSDNQFSTDVERRPFPYPSDREAASGVNAERGADEAQTPGNTPLAERLSRLERQNRYNRLMFLATLVLTTYLAMSLLAPRPVTVQKVITESDEVKLLDSSGTTRLYLRMYSHEPILQVMDSAGSPRLSLGLRFDDTPFIDLYDGAGRTRATFQMSEDDEPALRLYDEQGEPSFTIN